MSWGYNSESCCVYCKLRRSQRRHDMYSWEQHQVSPTIPLLRRIVSLSLMPVQVLLIIGCSQVGGLRSYEHDHSPGVYISYSSFLSLLRYESSTIQCFLDTHPHSFYLAQILPIVLCTQLLVSWSGSPCDTTKLPCCANVQVASNYPSTRLAPLCSLSDHCKERTTRVTFDWLVGCQLSICNLQRNRPLNESNSAGWCSDSNE
jgi:hypothetical protein